MSDSIRILAIGDVIGRPGRNALIKGLARARSELNPHFVIVNGENLAGGFGITKKIFTELTEEHGVDCITTGNHWMDKQEIYEFIDHPKLVLPANMFNVDPMRCGYRVFRMPYGTVSVVNMIGKVFMKGENRCPFESADKMLEHLPQFAPVRIFDFHAEATSEKQGIGQYLRGRASLVYGTHSHVPTADQRLFPEGTAFATDIGMTGPFDSVIGIRSEAAIRRMRTGEKKNFEPASTPDLWFNALLCDVDAPTGKATAIERVCWRGIA